MATRAPVQSTAMAARLPTMLLGLRTPPFSGDPTPAPTRRPVGGWQEARERLRPLQIAIAWVPEGSAVIPAQAHIRPEYGLYSQFRSQICVGQPMNVQFSAYVWKMGLGCNNRSDGKCSAGGGAGADGEGGRLHPPQFGDAAPTSGQVRGLVDPAPVGDGCEERAVGLDCAIDQAVRGRRRRGYRRRILNVMDAAERDTNMPAFRHRSTSAGPPVKQCNTVLLGTPSALRTSNRSSQASRAWMTRVREWWRGQRDLLPRRRACCTSRGECS